MSNSTLQQRFAASGTVAGAALTVVNTTGNATLSRSAQGIFLLTLTGGGIAVADVMPYACASNATTACMMINYDRANSTATVHRFVVDDDAGAAADPDALYVELRKFTSL